MIGGKIALQCCVGFCHTTMQLTHNYTYTTSLLNLPPFPSPYPSRSSQSTRLGSLCLKTTSCQLSILHMIGTPLCTLAWKIPWKEEPGRLQSTGSLWVGHEWANSLSLFTFILWRRKWQPTPVFLPWESQGWGSLVGCRLWGCTESDTTEAT